MIKRILLFLAGCLCILGSWSAYNMIHNHAIEEDAKVFQDQLDKKEIEMQRLLFLKNQSLLKKQANRLHYDFFVYQQDSLIDWSSNAIPVSPYADIHFPENGLIQLQNGWYIVHYKVVGSKKIAITYRVKTTYPIENNHLINQFTGDFSSFSGTLSSNPEDGALIHDKLSSRKLAFKSDTKQNLSATESFLIELFALFGIGLIFYLTLLSLQRLQGCIIDFSIFLSQLLFWLFLSYSCSDKVNCFYKNFLQ